MTEKTDLRRHLPSVDKLLQSLNAMPALNAVAHQQKVDAIRSVLDRIRAGRWDRPPEMEAILAHVVTTIESRQKRGIRKVVNAAGIILHTNLGRAVLPQEAMQAIAAMNGYCNLQINLKDGSRGRREEVIEDLLGAITGAEAATVVNNNAAATLLVLAALCQGKEVIVSRGQLIEIGGSFRLPDVIAQSGARMVEVGTTNKTHLRDYDRAFSEETQALLRVNPSNYRIIGFSQQVSTADMVSLKDKHDFIMIDDLGCGALFDLSHYGLPYEPTVQNSIKAGADVALFSGDKLISGPQSGIIVGKKKYIDLIRKHPLMRVMRVDKFTIAALEATLKLFLEPDRLRQTHPALRMIAMPWEDLQQKANALKEKLSPLIACDVIDGESVCGGGSLPDCPLKTALVALRPQNSSAEELARALRLADTPVIPRVQKEEVCLDVRTLLDGDDGIIESVLTSLKDML